MSRHVPARIQVAVDVVAPGPDDRLLEIGCGPGVAMDLVCERLDDGHVTGLDRSATAIARAEKRLWRHLEKGSADLQHRDLAGFHGDGRPFDAVFAINVNVFWANPAGPEAARLRELVADDGVVRLFYERPRGVHDSRAADVTRSVLGAAGFATRADVIDDVLCVTGTPLPRAEP